MKGILLDLRIITPDNADNAANLACLDCVEQRFGGATQRSEDLLNRKPHYRSLPDVRDIYPFFVPVSKITDGHGYNLFCNLGGASLLKLYVGRPRKSGLIACGNEFGMKTGSQGG